MRIDNNALDRHITGNYGEDQFSSRPECRCADLVYIGHEPDDYDYPETGAHPVYQCRYCGDITNEAWEVQRDGGRISPYLSSHNEAFAWILDHTPYSVHHAVTYEGYSIEKTVTGEKLIPDA